MSEYQAYPLSWPLGWPRNKFAERSRFGNFDRKPTVAVARDLVIHQLRLMGVEDWNVIISTNIPLRRDGLPYSNQREPNDMGVAVYWKKKGKQLVLACDKYNTVGDNLYAIGKTIEAQRAIERWGSVTAEQAFEGYARLPEKTQPSCWDVLGIETPTFPLSDYTRRLSERHILETFRGLSKELHPDKGGSSEAFDSLVQAKNTALQLIR